MGQDRVGHGDIHVAPLPAGAGVQQRGENPHHRREGAAEQVTDLEPGNRRRPAGRSHLVEDTRVADVVDVVARSPDVGTILAIPGDRAVHDAGTDGPHGFVADTKPVHHTRPETLDDHVGPPGQLQERFASLGTLEIQREAALVAIDGPVEVAGSALFPAATHGAHVVAGAGVLDLDDVGAEVGEVEARHRARQEAGQVEHPDAGKRLMAHGVLSRRARRGRRRS